jgi:hypothetical protein
MSATPAVRHLQQLDELITKVVREADAIRDYVQLRFHDDVVLTFHNAVELDGRPVTNSPSGRTLLASVVGRMVNDVARAADCIVLNFRDGPTLTMSLQPAVSPAAEVLTLSARRAAAAQSCSGD